MLSFSETTDLVRTFNWQSPSWDLFIFMFWGVASLVYAFTAGRGRIVNILISLYIAKLLVLEAPFLTQAISGRLPESLGVLQQLVTFLILFLLLFVFLGRLAFRTSVDSKHLISSMFFGLIFAVLQIGLLINMILSFTTQTFHSTLSPLSRWVFINDPASFIWLITPLIYLILVGKRIADTNEI